MNAALSGSGCPTPCSHVRSISAVSRSSMGHSRIRCSLGLWMEHKVPSHNLAGCTRAVTLENSNRSSSLMGPEIVDTSSGFWSSSPAALHSAQSSAPQRYESTQAQQRMACCSNRSSPAPKCSGLSVRPQWHPVMPPPRLRRGHPRRARARARDALPSGAARPAPARATRSPATAWRARARAARSCRSAGAS